MSTPSTASDETFDIVIAGGGLVGGSLALALASTSARVALVEAVTPESNAQPSFDDRTLALSHGSCRILRQLGLWPALQETVWPVHRIHVSEQGHFGTALLDAREQGLGELGFVIKSHALGRALWEQLRTESSLTCHVPARITATCMNDEGWRELSLECDSGEQHRLRTRLLVVADGARSLLRNALDINTRETDYGQTAIVANIAVASRYTSTQAYERFTSEGPLAMLPGANGAYTLVLACASERAAELQALSAAEFGAVIQHAMGTRLGRLGLPGQRSAYPLRLVQASRLIAERAVLVGNAAHSLHPVAGQGFNLGLRDVACLAELITNCCSAGTQGDPGAADLLHAYADWRADDQHRVVAFTDGLIRLFGLHYPGFASARGLGLALFDIVPGARRELARHTMGLSGRTSRLQRGAQG